MDESQPLFELHVSSFSWFNSLAFRFAPQYKAPHYGHILFSGYEDKPSLYSNGTSQRKKHAKFETQNAVVGEMSPAESDDVVGLNFKETELTLALPGESQATKTRTKRGFSKTVDLHLGSSSCSSMSEKSENNSFCSTKSPAPKAQVVGWPPVRASRKNVIKSCKYVKVAVDGAPYLRKVDLEMYESYEQLLRALGTMFCCLTIRNHLNQRKIMELGNGVEYVPTYEDKDGDWMLVGDVPWKMFVESCRRIRLMISSEAIGLAPRTPSKCTSSS